MESNISSNQDIIIHTPNYWESKDTSALDKGLVGFNADFNAVSRDETVSVPGRAARKFSSLDEIMKTIRPVLAKHKLYAQQMITGDEMITMVRHESGQFRCISAPMLQWQGQGTNSLQNLGGAITYLKRYYLSAALCLATEEDDDGNSAGKIAPGKAATKPAPQDAAPPVKLDETVVDAWQSKVNECKEPDDFERLSKEMAGVQSEPVKKFVKAAMGKRMEDTGVVYDKEAKVFFKKPADGNA
jgi:hypothetical protein